MNTTIIIAVIAVLICICSSVSGGVAFYMTQATPEVPAGSPPPPAAKSPPPPAGSPPPPAGSPPPPAGSPPPPAGVTCKADGTWSNNSPVPPGTVITRACPSGGNQTAKCKADGNWESDWQCSAPPYKNLCNKHNKCLASPANNSGTGVKLIQYDKTSEEGQLWRLNAEGNLCNKHNKCLAAASGNNGEIMVQWDKNSQDGQLWTLNAEGNLCNKLNKCLASPANNSGVVELIQWDKTGEQGQLWSFV